MMDKEAKTSSYANSEMSSDGSKKECDVFRLCKPKNGQSFKAMDRL
jgi:hypothetical protein